MNILSVLGAFTRFGQWSRVLEQSGDGSCRHQGGIVGVISGEIKGIFLLWSPFSERWWETGEMAKSREEVVGQATQEGSAPPILFFCCALIHFASLYCSSSTGELGLLEKQK